MRNNLTFFAEEFLFIIYFNYSPCVNVSTVKSECIFPNVPYVNCMCPTTSRNIIGVNKKDMEDKSG